MATKSFPVFDCDSHIVEPPEIWEEYVPARVRAWAKTQFHFHTDTETLLINGRAVPASRERANAAEVGWPRWNKKEVGRLTPGTEEWKARFGRLKGSRDPRARLRDMDALGTDQVMLFPSCEALTSEWAQRIAPARAAGTGLLFTDEAVVYSPGQFVSNIVFAMEPTIDASESLGFIMEAMTWLTTVLMTGWLQKFPRLTCAVLESNATWLPMVLGRSRNFLDLYAFQRGRETSIADPSETFYRRCFIAFESDEEPVYRMWDLYENVGIWSSDYPHHDAEDVWDALEAMAKFAVPEPVQRKLLGENARRLYGIEPVLVVKERIEDFRPEILAW